MSINTDSEKLVNRINANKKYQKFDIGNWILQQVNFSDGEKLLDIGCGTGEQLLKFSGLGSNSKIFGIDASETSLSIIREQCTKNKISNVNLILGDLDNLQSLLKTADFDIVSSCFALYYSKNIPQLITTIKSKLKSTGRLFVCGSVESNNEELIAFQKSILDAKMPSITYEMTETILPEIKKNFPHVTTSIFENPIQFLEADTLFKYWSSYYLYDAKIERIFKEKLDEHFKTNDSFVTTKKIIGIKASLNEN